MDFLIPLLIICSLILIIVLKGTDILPSGKKRAGRKGEKAVSNIINSVLRDGDLLFTNVSVSYDGKQTELDNVIVNSHGVFIIEVKNYIGKIVGNEDDFKWKKYKITGAGNVYEKAVKNPIKQVKRQIYILSHYLDANGTRVWVDGYTILLHGNSPVESEHVLSSVGDIDRAIHTLGRNRLSRGLVAAIAELLS